MDHLTQVRNLSTHQDLRISISFDGCHSFTVRLSNCWY